MGHTLRKEDREIPKAALLWNPQGNRNRGRPRNRWRRSVIKEAGRSWNKLRYLAADRRKWKRTHRQPVFLEGTMGSIVIIIIKFTASYFPTLKVLLRITADVCGRRVLIAEYTLRHVILRPFLWKRDVNFCYCYSKS